MSHDLHIHVDDQGHPRPLGCQLVEPRLTWPQFGTAGQGTPPLIDRHEWADRIHEMKAGRSSGQVLDEADFAPITDQGPVGQCNANGTISMIEALRKLQGLDYVELSPADLYGRINGGVDRGSMPEDAMTEMLSRGVGTAATCGRVWAGRSQVYAKPDERARFKALEVWQCPTFDHLMSATLMGFFGVSAIMWYDNYTRVDADGWLPEGGQGNYGGHAFFKLNVADFRGTSGNYRYAIGNQNSWRPSWGRGGRMYVAERCYGRFSGQWVARLAVTETGDVPAPKFN